MSYITTSLPIKSKIEPRKQELNQKSWSYASKPGTRFNALVTHQNSHKIQVIDLRKGRALQKGQLAIIAWKEPLMTSSLSNFLLGHY